MIDLRKTAQSVFRDFTTLDRKIVIVLLASVILIAVRNVVFIERYFWDNVSWFPMQMPVGRFGYMYATLWWAVGCIFLYFCIPALLTKFALKMRLRDCGFTLSGTLRTAPIFIILYLLMLPILIYVSNKPEFLNVYPFPFLRVRGQVAVPDFLLWQLFYGVQFIALEFLFRGFMLFPLEKKLGYNAIFVMVLPYTMIHILKPAPELFGAVFTGVLLGYLALRTRSIFGCVALHYAVALTMDILALVNRKAFFI